MPGYQYSTAIPNKGLSRSAALVRCLLAFGLLGVTAHIAASGFEQWWLLARRGVTVEAQVTAVSPHLGLLSWGMLTGQPDSEVLFYDDNGEPQRRGVSGTSGRVRPGNFVEVVHDPDRPDAPARLASDQAAGLPIPVWVATAASCLAFLLVALVAWRLARVVRDE